MEIPHARERCRSADAATAQDQGRSARIYDCTTVEGIEHGIFLGVQSQALVG